MTEETGRYRTPGELVQSAREAAGLSVADLAARTRISEHMLTALEADDYGELSGPLYVRSFLKSLAAELQLDVAQLLDRYERIEAPEEPMTEGEPTWETETRVERVQGVPWRVVGMAAAGLLVVVLLVWGGVALFGGGDDDPVAVEEPVEEQQEIVAAANPDTVEVASEDPPTDDADDDHPDDTPAAQPEETVREPDPAPVETETARPIASLPPGTERLVFSGGDRYPLVLRLVCDDRIGAAVAVDADDALHGVDWRRALPGVPEEGIVPGQPYRVGGRLVAYWGARDHFVVRLEESDGVELSLNGQVQPIPARNLGREWVLDATRVRR